MFFLFAANQPGDSGVGVSSVGSSSMTFPAMKSQMSESTLEALNTKASVFAGRNFTENFHEFVDLCSLDVRERPTARYGHYQVFQVSCQLKTTYLNPFPCS